MIARNQDLRAQGVPVLRTGHVSVTAALDIASSPNGSLTADQRSLHTSLSGRLLSTAHTTVALVRKVQGFAMGFVVVGKVSDLRVLPSQDGKGSGIGIGRLIDMGFDSNVIFTDVANMPKDGIWIQAEPRISADVNARGKAALKVTVGKWQQVQPRG